jgi:hypothetical protein
MKVTNYETATQAGSIIGELSGQNVEPFNDYAP